ncbi:hypothetical protein Q1695_010226 [Nippostrongylus brasiliensis]|nr:hypothetical protein Q1695_010226 [Nippostrongylus brasiliensis]
MAVAAESHSTVECTQLSETELHDGDASGYDDVRTATVSPYPQPGASTPSYEGCCRASQNGTTTEVLEVYDSHPCPQASLSPGSIPLDIAVESVPAFSRFRRLEILRSLGRSTTLSPTGSGDPCTAFDYDSSKKGGSEERRRAGQETSSRRSRVSTGVGVYYGCGEAQTDFLVAMGMLLMSILVTILIMIKGTQSWLISLLYIVFKIIDFIIGYLAARQANRVLYILTLVITIVVLVGGIYFAARAIVGIVDHPSMATFSFFLIYAVEVALIIHIIYFCTKLM